MNPQALPHPDLSVLVICRDAIVRAGLAATLDAVPGLRVQVPESTSEIVSESGAQSAIGGADVVVADYDSALALARALRRGGFARPAPSTRIMIVSQRSGEADVCRALECGIQGYISLESASEDVVEGVIALHRGQRVLGRLVAQRMAESFDHETLTSREVDVLRHVVAGHANKVVARKLNIAVGTVKVHVRSILAKLGAQTRTEAAAVAQRRGLVDSGPETDVPSAAMRWALPRPAAAQALRSSLSGPTAD
jgi:DNA-binding NarL/FixJ family response regulator